MNRLFDQIRPAQTLTETQINAICEIMLDGTRTQISNIPAGYTYLGQMISHDIIPSTKSSNVDRDNVMPQLMLSGLYGNESNPVIGYENLFDNGMFVFQNMITLKRTVEAGDHLDLYRNCGQVLTPEIRNDENVLISQLHLFWQKIHNVIFDNYLHARIDPQKKFLMTKELVIKMFQQVVVDDFLYHLLDKSVYELYISGKMPYGQTDGLYMYPDSQMSGIPVEFSHAAFRFGHSMVRDDYQLNNEFRTRVPLRELFIRSHGQNIQISKEVAWSRFFDVHSTVKPEKANRIDPHIVNPMGGVPVRGARHNIARLNLEAGIQAHLPSGYSVLETVIKHFDGLDLAGHSNPFANYVIPSKNPFESVVGKVEDLPLWLYLLVEADFHSSGHKLGLLGSFIVAEVIFQSINSAPVSIFERKKSDLEVMPGILGSLKHTYTESQNVDDVFNQMLNRYRRFTMTDVIDIYQKYKL